MQLIEAIQSSKVFILLLTENSFPMEEGEMIVREIREALKLEKTGDLKFIPVFDEDFKWPKNDENEKNVPEDIQNFMDLNGVKWSHTYRDASFQRILDFIMDT